MWIHYIGGHGAGNKLITVEIGLGDDPEGHLASLRRASPFKLRLLKLEEGSLQRLENLQASFKSIQLNGSWYRANAALKSHIEALPEVDRSKAKSRRVSLLLTPSEFAELEKGVQILHTKTKNRLMRKALRAYLQLVRYYAQGFKIQAIKGGKLVQLNNELDFDEPNGQD